ncbi:MAG: MAPEG family protein [Caldimonas sp.]
MTPALPTISATVAALLGLLAALLTARVIVLRVRFKVDAGDGGHAPLAQAIRAQSNFAELAPIAILLLTFAEWSIAWRWLIVGLGAALLVARLASAWGLSHSLGPSQARQAGAGLTILVIIVASLLLLYRGVVML